VSAVADHGSGNVTAERLRPKSKAAIGPRMPDRQCNPSGPVSTQGRHFRPKCYRQAILARQLGAGGVNAARIDLHHGEAEMHLRLAADARRGKVAVIDARRHYDVLKRAVDVHGPLRLPFLALCRFIPSSLLVLESITGDRVGSAGRGRDGSAWRGSAVAFLKRFQNG
jgi:hypothetical protein